MQADAQFRHPSRPSRGVRRSRRPDHQACGGEHAPAVGDLHGVVDRDVGAEIVGGDDQSV
jgi:hypothetical protein